MKMFRWVALVIALIGLHALAAEDTCKQDGGPAYCVAGEATPWAYQASDGNTSGQGADAATAIANYRANYLASLAAGNITVCSLNITDNLPSAPSPSMGVSSVQAGDYNGSLTTGTGSYWSIDSYLSQESQSVRIPLKVTLVSQTFSSAPCEYTRTHGVYVQRVRQVACPDFPLYSHNSTTAYCYRPAAWREPTKSMGQQCPSTPNPVNIASGNKFQIENDYVGSGNFPLQFVRTYNNRLWRGISAPQGFGFWSKLGPNWRSTYDRAVYFQNAAIYPSAYVYRHDGRRLYFHLTGGQFVPDEDIADRLVRLVDGSGTTTGWKYTIAASEEVETYDANGRLISLANRAGLTQSLAYDTAGRLISVTDSFGRQLQFGYDTNGKLTTMTDPNGQVFTYAYNTAGNVNQVTYPGNTSRVYLYGESAYTGGVNAPFALTGIQDESGVRFATYQYDYDERVTSTEHAGGVDKYTLSYGSGLTSNTVTDPLNTTRTYSFMNVQSVGKNLAMSQPCTSGCGGGSAAATTYDDNGNVASRTDFKGNKSCFAYNLARNLETVRLEGLASTVSCPTNLSTYTPTSGTRERKISTQWHSTFRRPTQVDEAGKRTTYTHDTSGNVLTKTELDTALGLSRSWTYTYNSVGQVLTANGPRTDVLDVTTYTYYSCATGFQCGQVHTVTNAAGHVTTYNTYNAHGQPLTITDPNGVVTTLTYDLRRRMTSRTVGTEVTTFTYWPIGQLKRATMPDGSYLEYTYDGAHRLTRIEDSEGNRVVYTLDNMGNSKEERTYDASSSTTATLIRRRDFDGLNRLWKQVGAANTAAVTTTFGYDNNGNQSSISAPLSHNTSQLYDELNRLKQITDPLTGVTQYGYNALDQLISVTDPRNNVTSYTYNSIGDLTQQVSPDTGTTTNTYDSGGNLATSTDARNKTATYGYDAINRITGITYPDQTITYTYDTGTNQKGRLTQVTDNSGSTSWTYDSQGRMTSKQQSMGVTKTIGYAYDSYGRLQTLTLPSGNTAAYGYTDGKVTSLTLNGSTTILSNVLYEPFGPTRGWTWGNSTLTVRGYDQDGKITDIDSAGLKTYSYDNAFRITSITDASDSALSQNYGYDLLDRLTSATGTGLNQSWTYDANGNRLTQSGNASSTYATPNTSNRLASVSGALTRSYTYDNAGNTIADGTATFVYNDARRMISSTKSAVTTTYALNALGQRVRKTTGSTSRYFAYDEAGHLIGEYDNTGTLIQEILWLGDIPVATVRPNGGGVVVFYIHTDHLNAPRRISRPGDNAVIWRWDADPFGMTAANQDPDGDATLFAFSLRFPGQYSDAETGLNYNHFRDYDPSTGRYVQSDPIGLYGGWNTYRYAFSNPLSGMDFDGLAVTWTGSLTAGGATAGIGGQLLIFKLESECKCNVKYKIEGFASLLTVGAGVQLPRVSKFFADGAGSTGNITFVDEYFDCPDPDAASGFAWAGGINFIPGVGGSFLSTVDLGRLRASDAITAPSYGFDISIQSSIPFFARSAVWSSEKIECCSSGK